MKIDIFDAATASSFVVEIYRRFGRSRRLHLQRGFGRPLQRTQVKSSKLHFTLTGNGDSEGSRVIAVLFLQPGR